MVARFSRLYSLNRNLYVSGSPIIILAGALLLDNETEKLLAQLKFKNISTTMIKAIKVEIICKDTANRILDENVTYQYLDLKEKRGSEFGSNVPIILSGDTTRSFEVRLLEVIDTNNNIWQGEKLVLKPISDQDKLPYQGEILKEYRLKYGRKSKLIFRRKEDLWFCTCGAINHLYENTCYECGIGLNALELFDEEKLIEEANERVATELAEAEKQRIANEEKALIKKELQDQKLAAIFVKCKKISFAMIPLIVIMCAAYGGFIFYKEQTHSVDLNKAQTFYNYGNYLDAADILSQYDSEESQELLQEIMLAYIVDEYVSIKEELVELIDYYVWMYNMEALYRTGKYVNDIPIYIAEIEELYKSSSSIYSEYKTVFTSDVLEQLPESFQSLDEVFGDYAVYGNDFYYYIINRSYTYTMLESEYDQYLLDLENYHDAFEEVIDSLS